MPAFDPYDADRPLRLSCACGNAVLTEPSPNVVRMKLRT